MHSCACNRSLDVFVRLVGWLIGCLRVRQSGYVRICVCGYIYMFVVLDVCVYVQTDLVGDGFHQSVFLFNFARGLRANCVQ